jgi:hypothetical protein
VVFRIDFGLAREKRPEDEVRKEREAEKEGISQRKGGHFTTTVKCPPFREMPSFFEEKEGISQINKETFHPAKLYIIYIIYTIIRIYIINL